MFILELNLKEKNLLRSRKNVHFILNGVYLFSMMKQHMEDLEIVLDASNMSDRTKENYIRPVKLFLNYINSNEITSKSLLKYQAHLKRKKYKPSTMKLHTCAIKYFLRKVLNREDLANSMPSIRQGYNLPIILSKNEVKRIIGSALNDTHKMILLILYTTGVRLAELLSIKIGDIDIDRKEILIHGKGRRDRFVPINDNVINLIKNTTSDLKYKNHLCTVIRKGPMDKTRRRMSFRTIGKIIENCSDRAGITKRVYPHLLRHSIATHLLEDGVDIRYIQVLLGHTSILATAGYTHIAKMKHNVIDLNINYLFD